MAAISAVGMGRAAVRLLDRWIGGGALSEAESEARRAHQRLQAAIDAFPEGVVFLDPAGRYIQWNAKYAEIYHRSADLFAPGRRLAETLAIGVARGDYPEAAGREEAWLAERLEKLANPTGERLEQQLADGRWLMVEDRRTADGGLIGLRVDITEMKQRSADLAAALKREAAANRARTEFLSDMSHELRTPLNGVMGLAQALQTTSLAPDQKSLVDDILASASTLESLVSGLLAYGEGETPCAPSAEAGLSTAASGAGTLRVLLADDNPTNRRVVELMLGAAGVEVVSVENGAEACEAVAHGGFDLVLMDLRMPVMDGFEAISAIRAAEGDSSPRLPIIVLSANASPEDRAASAAAGADFHLAKPILAPALFGAMSEALDG